MMRPALLLAQPRSAATTASASRPLFRRLLHQAFRCASSALWPNSSSAGRSGAASPAKTSPESV
eukprot:10177680-Alexandrium_andersonii.AAC.1